MNGDNKMQTNSWSVLLLFFSLFITGFCCFYCFCLFCFTVPSTDCTWCELPPTLPLRLWLEWGPDGKKSALWAQGKEVRSNCQSSPRWSGLPQEAVNLLSRKVLKHKMTFKVFPTWGLSDSMNQNDAASFRPWVCWGLSCVWGMGSSWASFKETQPKF